MCQESEEKKQEYEWSGLPADPVHRPERLIDQRRQ